MSLIIQAIKNKYKINNSRQIKARISNIKLTSEVILEKLV